MNDKKMCDCNQGSFPCSCKGEAMEAAACMVVALLHIGTAKWMDRHYG